MSLKLYYDLISQPSRALYIFFKANKIPFTDCSIRLGRGQHMTSEYEKINPFKRVPAIDHGGFKLAESIAIFRYTCREFPVADHWYPKTNQLRSKVDEYLEWQHLNLRLGGAMYFMTKWIYPVMTGEPVDEVRLKTYEQKLEESLDQIENIFLKNNKFIAGNEISFADLLCACELEQPCAIGYDIFKGGKRVQLENWMKKIKENLNPLYSEAHVALHKVVKKSA